MMKFLLRPASAFCLFMFLFTPGNRVWADEPSRGAGLLSFTDSVASMGRGGTGVSSRGSDLFFLNPSAIANAERFSLDLQYGTLQASFYNPQVSVAVPTDYGVFGGTFRYLNFPGAADFNNAYSLTLGSGKEITSWWSVGMAFTFLYTQGSTHDFFAGVVLGTSFHLKSVTSPGGFGIIRPSLGLSVMAGVPFGGNWLLTNMNSLTLGYSFTFFENSYVSIRWNNDLSMIYGYTAFPVKLGLEVEIIRSIYVRGGVILPFLDNYGHATFGLGYTFNQAEFSLSANYACTVYRNASFVHYLGLNVSYGTIDRIAPRGSVIPDFRYISPNNDGVQDSVTMKLTVVDSGRIKGWYLRFLDEKGAIVREYKPADRDIPDGISFAGFFSRLFERKTTRYVPAEIIWDGKDSRGMLLPDGKYEYRFSAWDERDNVSLTQSGTILIDTVSPEVAVEAIDRFFSPNGDNNKDLLYLRQTVSLQGGDRLKAVIETPQGVTIKNFSWPEGPPQMQTWDGKDDQGKDAAEGIYRYRIESTDGAGNRKSALVDAIILTRQYESADIHCSENIVSLKKISMVRFFPRLSTDKNLDEWNVTVTGKNDRAVKIITGKGTPPPFIEWDLKDIEGKPLADGSYRYRLTARYTSGNAPASFARELVVDSSPPTVSLTKDLLLFSPDGDNENDLLTIQPRSNDASPIREWKLAITTPSGEPFKTYSGKGALPEKLLWDGMSDRRELVESATDYRAVLEAVDEAGNEARSGVMKIPVDILVTVTERGLKMRVSAITFRINSAELSGGGSTVLNRVNQILTRYENYDVVIEGHTDDIGDEEYNMELSEQRAKAVRDFLVTHGIAPDRLHFIGMGESMPLYPNDSDENRRKNRRVEFLMVKRGQEK